MALEPIVTLTQFPFLNPISITYQALINIIIRNIKINEGFESKMLPSRNRLDCER